jgi:uncharacterized protein YjbI with pentapeptide repeats
MPESSLEIRKPLPILKKSLKANFGDFTKALTKAGANAAIGNWSGAATSGIDLVAAVGLGTTLAETAWLLTYRALCRATSLIAKECKDQRPESNLNLDELNSVIENALNNQVLSVNSRFFQYPDKHPIVEIVRPHLDAWLAASEISTADSRAIASRLPAYFGFCLHDEWRENPNVYEILRTQLDTPFTKATERLQGLSRYAAFLQKVVDEPLFLESFSLRQIFVPPRASYQSKTLPKIADATGTGKIASGKPGKHVVVDLMSELKLWVDRGDKNDAIRLLSGGPGSGKSSLCKMFAAEQARKGKTSVLLIPMHHFSPTDDLVDAVGNFVKEDGFLNANPLDFTQIGSETLLLIFDGLDELAMQGKIGERTAQDFVREVQRKVERFNQQQTRLQVLISGRELVIQANESSFRKDGQILYVLPYYIPEDERSAYSDANSLLSEDQRVVWWRRYGEVSGSGHTSLPTALQEEKFIEVTSQPLLNYLVALSLRRGKLDLAGAVNLNALYADLLKAIYERGWAANQHASIQGIDEAGFERILEEIALASWHGDGRTTTVAEIESHCRSSSLLPLLKQFQTRMEGDAQAQITQLLAAFYFRQSGTDRSGDRTFEFTHKSFGEYLTARRILREVRLATKKLAERSKSPDDGWDEREALHRWNLLCGQSAIDQYLLTFIRDEVRLQSAERETDVIAWQYCYVGLLNFALRNGMPMERLAPRPSFSEERRLSRNAEEALLVVMNACGTVSQKVSQINWGGRDSCGSWLGRLMGQRPLWEHNVTLKCLSYTSLANCNFHAFDFWHANLFGSDLSGSNFVAAECRYANFGKTNLWGTNFAYAHLRGAILSGATQNIPEASLREMINGSRGLRVRMLNYGRNAPVSFTGALMEHAVLENCTLLGADFEDAALDEAKISNSDFSMAAFSGATLHQTVIKKTRLKNADLIGVSLKTADIDASSLKGAKLRAPKTKRKT